MPAAGLGLLHRFQHFVAEDRIPRSVHNVSDVFFGKGFINVFINELVSVFDNLYDNFFIRPLDKLFGTAPQLGFPNETPFFLSQPKPS